MNKNKDYERIDQFNQEFLIEDMKDKGYEKYCVEASSDFGYVRLDDCEIEDDFGDTIEIQHRKGLIYLDIDATNGTNHYLTGKRSIIKRMYKRTNYDEYLFIIGDQEITITFYQ